MNYYHLSKSDLYDMTWSSNFKPVGNDLQKNLTEDINNIKSFENLLIFADNTTNLLCGKACFHLHKENFKHKANRRLINPSKGEMGVVSKKF